MPETQTKIAITEEEAECLLYKKGFIKKFGYSLEVTSGKMGKIAW